MNTPCNRLHNATSPYLLQHADNPVHWQPWDEEALSEALREDKPILLSIGYSACHWCHVMAHESFEDAETAELMNSLYVNIKVDREERPDLDRIYQVAHQLLTRRPGGWPLTLVLTPRGHAPIFAGTYFPREPRHGMPTFRRVLTEVEAHYRSHRGAMDEHDAAMRHNLERLGEPGDRAGAPPEKILDAATGSLVEQVDRRHGGFGRAPKFPHAGALGCLVEALGDAEADPNAIEAALRPSLDGMAGGGLFDQLGGGFYRYSVDDAWQIPHFEKMLYDNAQLMSLYATASRTLGNDQWRETAIDTAMWVIRDMQLADGGFCSSVDADSEGGEGIFYLWAPGEIEEVLDDVSARFVTALFGLDAAPNFEGFHHLNRACTLADAARAADIDPLAASDTWRTARERLLAHRDARSHPGRDDKCLTAWNALTIDALAQTGRLLDRPDLVDAAGRALDFLRANHVREGRLFAVSRGGRAHLEAYLDDHAFLARALLSMLQWRWSDADLRWCVTLVETILTRFAGPDGGLYFTGDDHEALLYRPRIASDDSTPSGNGVACEVLLELGHLLGETRYLDAAESLLGAFGDEIAASPAGHATLLSALRAARRPITRVILRGDEATCRQWSRQLTVRHGQRVRSYPVGAAEAPGVAGTQGAESTTAWICTGSRCLPPLTTLTTLQRALEQTIE